MKKFDTNRDGSIDYVEFVQALKHAGGRSKPQSTTTRTSLSNTDRPRLTSTDKASLSRIFRVTFGRKLEDRELRECRSMFRMVDNSDAGNVSVREFRRCVRDLDFNFGSRDIDLMVDILDKERTGKVDYRVLVHELQHFDPSRRSPRNKLDDSEDEVDLYATNSFRLGQRVQARFKGRSKYYPAKVTKVHKDGTYNLAYDDGDREQRVPGSYIKEAMSSPSNPADDSADMSDGSQSADFRTGDTIEARYKGGSKYFKGKIKRVHPGGQHYDILYDDGDRESRVSKHLIRKAPHGRHPQQKSEIPSKKYTVGQAVEARYKGGRRFYTGTVSRVYPNNTYDIKYDDGALERRVPQSLIRSPEDEDMGTSSQRLRVNDRVEARMNGGSRYVRGKITRENADGSFCITYDNGERERRVERRLIRKVLSFYEDSESDAVNDDALSFRLGERVEARYKRGSKFYPGKVAKVNRDGTYKVVFDDGDVDPSVEAASMRKLEAVLEPSFASGDEVEARYKGGRRYYKGIVTRAYPDGRCDIRYEDGDSEKRVDPTFIRVAESKANDKHSHKSRERFKRGQRVEARFKGKSKYYPGRILLVNRDGTYDIAYDDGDEEQAVMASFIRLPASSERDQDADRFTDENNAEDEPVLFKRGDRIQAQARHSNRFLSGRITSVNRDGTYDVTYDSGKRERRVLSRRVRKELTAFVDRLRAVIQEAVRKGVIRGSEHAFRLFDRERQGAVSRRDMCRALDRLEMEYTAEEVQFLFDQVDGGKSGRITRQAFARYMKKGVEDGASGEDSRSDVSGASVRRERSSRSGRKLSKERRGRSGSSSSSRNSKDSSDHERETRRSNGRRRSKSRSNSKSKTRHGARSRSRSRGRSRSKSKTRGRSKSRRRSRSSSLSSSNDSATSSSGSSAGGESWGSESEGEEVKIQVFQGLKRVVKQDKAGKYKKVFKSQDKSGSGVVDAKHACKIFKRLGVGSFSPEELTPLLDKRGRLKYRDLVKKSRDWSPSRAKMQGSTVELIEEKLLKELNKMKNDGETFGDVFDKIDTNNDGVISKRELSKALHKFGLELSKKDVSRLMAALDKNQDGRIQYDEFLNFCGEQKRKGKDRGAEVSIDGAAVKSLREERVVDEETLQNVQKIFRTAVDSGVVADYKDLFELLDCDKDGNVDEGDLNQALEKLKIDLTEEESLGVIQGINGSGAKRFTYKQFLLFLSSGKDREKWVKGLDGKVSGCTYIGEVESRLREKVRKSSLQKNRGKSAVLTKFKKHDSYNTGAVSKKDLKKVATACHWSLTEEDLKVLMARFDVKGHGKFSYKEFLSFLMLTDDAVYGVQQRVSELVRWITSNGATMEECFQMFDRQGRGKVSQDEFAAAMIKFGFPVTDMEVKELFRRVNVKRDGKLSFAEFCHAFKGSGSNPTVNAADKENCLNTLEEQSKILALASGKSHATGIYYDWTQGLAMGVGKSGLPFSPKGSVGAWLEEEASPLERRNFFAFLNMLSMFENRLQLQQKRSKKDMKDGQVVIQLGTKLKVAMKFII